MVCFSLFYVEASFHEFDLLEGFQFFLVDLLLFLVSLVLLLKTNLLLFKDKAKLFFFELFFFDHLLRVFHDNQRLNQISIAGKLFTYLSKLLHILKKLKFWLLKFVIYLCNF